MVIIPVEKMYLFVGQKEYTWRKASGLRAGLSAAAAVVRRLSIEETGMVLGYKGKGQMIRSNVYMFIWSLILKTVAAHCRKHFRDQIQIIEVSLKNIQGKLQIPWKLRAPASRKFI